MQRSERNQRGRPPKIIQDYRGYRWIEGSRRMRDLMEKKGVTRRDIVKQFAGKGLTDATFRNYFIGKRVPDLKYQKDLADLLGISVGYLIHGIETEAPTIVEVKVSPITDDEIQKIREILDKLG